jgi:hypothetical protein
MIPAKKVTARFVVVVVVVVVATNAEANVIVASKEWKQKITLLVWFCL